MDIFADSAHLLPLFWMRGEDEATLRRGVGLVNESGCGALCVESRTHPDFLGEGWWHDLGIVLDECKRRGMKAWVFDDSHFPSGYADGSADGTPYQRMMLTERHMDVNGPFPGASFCVGDDETTLRPEEGTVAVVAARWQAGAVMRHDTYVDIAGIAVEQPVDLTDTVRDGMAAWDVPEGRWRVYVLTARFVKERTPARAFANPLMSQSAQTMIDAIYSPHYQRFREAFGETLLGFFSDEPALRAGRGVHAVVGAYPMLPIPWRPGMLDFLNESFGANARVFLPGLWYPMGEMSHRIRYALMDTVSRLYSENYTLPLGDWCRAHGVSYIGHVIEQNNAHCRLGSGAGHYFRAIAGQDMAGIDVVLHEIRPGFTRDSHAWKSQDFEADDPFFHSMLAQMAVSAAHIDPKKKGRTMCEIFGAYGWQEDMGQMRYLAHYMLARGVNYFAPHAFSMQPFPDPDSPPHLLLKGVDSLAPFQHEVMDTMARAGGLLSGGAPITRTAVLYYAEGEWACGFDAMKTQTIMELLSRCQLEALVVPLDALMQADYDLLLIPHAERWPEKLLTTCRALLAKGKRVVFADALPTALSAGEGDVRTLTAGMEAMPLAQLPQLVRKAGQPFVRSCGDYPDVKHYPYRRGDMACVALMNEDVRKAVTFEADCADSRQGWLYDPDKDCAYALDSQPVPGGSRIRVMLEPSQFLIVMFTAEQPQVAARFGWGDTLDQLTPRWRISLREAGTEDFTPWRETETLCDVSAQEGMSRFCGTVRYEADITLTAGCGALDLGQCGGTAQVFDGETLLGTRHEAPYVFPLPDKPSLALRVEVSTALVRRHRDALSFFAAIPPTGMQGPVKIKQMQEV